MTSGNAIRMTPVPGSPSPANFDRLLSEENQHIKKPFISPDFSCMMQAPADVAQSVEHLLPKQRVASSNLVVRSIKISRKHNEHRPFSVCSRGKIVSDCLPKSGGMNPPLLGFELLDLSERILKR